MGNMKRKGKMQGYGVTSGSNKIWTWICIILFVLFVSVVISRGVHAADVTYPDITGVIFVYNYDGDTITVNIPTWPAITGLLMPIRVAGVDTPEIRGKCPEEKAMAKIVKRFVYDELSQAWEITISEPTRGKYYRIVGDVIYDGKSLSETLLSNGYGYPYDGGTKYNPWCDGLPLDE